MTATVVPRTQISVRVDQHVVDLLNAKIAQEKRNGRRVTKEKLVTDAITAAYDQPEHGWLPVSKSEWIAPVDLCSNAALLDFLDETETEGRHDNP